MFASYLPGERLPGGVRHLALVVAALLVLAGCSGGAGTPTAGVTPVPVPSDTPAAPANAAASEAMKPPWFIAATTATLGRVNYTVTEERRVYTMNGTLLSRYNRTTWVSPTGERLVRVRDEPDTTRYLEVWVDDERVLLASVGPDGTYSAAVSGAQAIRMREFYAPPHTRSQLVTVSRVVPLVHRGRVRVDRTSYTGRLADAAALDGVLSGSDPRNLSVSVTVDNSGTIRRYLLEYDAAVRGERVRMERVVHYRAITQTRVDPPTWVAARER
jgi:hypothetical protein